MKISIITTVRNRAATVRDAMESVARQRLSEAVELEYIVVDGGSTDGTVELVREFADRQAGAGDRDRPGNFSVRWISEPDRGMYDGIDKGIRMATGEVVGILNADDVLAGDRIVARVARQFELANDGAGTGSGGGRPPLDCVYGKVYFVDRLGGKMKRRCFARLWRPWMLQWGYMPPHPGIFIRRECFGKWGTYEPDRREYRIAADYELLIRFFRVHAMRAKYLDLYTTVMRTGGVSTRDVKARKKLNEEIIKANRANGYFCCWPMLLPKYAVKIWEVILPRLGICG